MQAQVALSGKGLSRVCIDLGNCELEGPQSRSRRYVYDGHLRDSSEHAST